MPEFTAVLSMPSREDTQKTRGGNSEWAHYLVVLEVRFN